jgi:hypothetical protein
LDVGVEEGRSSAQDGLEPGDAEVEDDDGGGGLGGRADGDEDCVVEVVRLAGLACRAARRSWVALSSFLLGNETGLVVEKARIGDVRARRCVLVLDHSREGAVREANCAARRNSIGPVGG